MSDESRGFIDLIYPSSLILHPLGRRSQVVRQRSAKPLFIGSIPIAASNPFNNLQEIAFAIFPKKGRFVCQMCATFRPQNVPTSSNTLSAFCQ